MEPQIEDINIEDIRRRWSDIWNTPGDCECGQGYDDVNRLLNVIDTLSRHTTPLFVRDDSGVILQIVWEE